MPREYSDMVRFALEGNFEKARRIHYKLFELTQAIFVDGNPAGIKGLLSALGICSEYVRLPLVSANRTTMNKFEELLMEKA